jgi:hypothetical protein
MNNHYDSGYREFVRYAITEFGLDKNTVYDMVEKEKKRLWDKGMKNSSGDALEMRAILNCHRNLIESRKRKLNETEWKGEK